MLLKKLETTRLTNAALIAAVIFLVSFQLVTAPVSYGQDNGSVNALPSITSLLLDEDIDRVQSCSNPLVPNYQIGLLFPGVDVINVTAGSLGNEISIESDEITDTQILAFLKAACFWQNVIVGDVSDGPTRTEVCARQVFGGSSFIIDDLLIFVEFDNIDGPGGALFQSGPCDVQNGIVKAGVMTFDSADLASLENRGVLDAVVRHEMGHVLGIGTVWNFFGFILDALPNNQPNLNLSQPKFIGSRAVAEYKALGGIGNFIAVENGFTNGVPNNAGPNGINGHLAQTALGTQELMTFQIGSSNPPLSRVTIATLEDIGYTVDYSQADDLPLP